MCAVVDPRFSSSKSRAIAVDATSGDWIAPLVLFCIGAVAIGIAFSSDAGPTVAAIGMAAFGVGLVIQVALGIGALFIVTSVLGGSAGSLGMAAIRLGGILTFCAATGMFFGYLGCLGAIINLVLMGILLVWLFEFETWEAVGVIVCLMGINILVWLIIVPGLAKALA